MNIVTLRQIIPGNLFQSHIFLDVGYAVANITSLWMIVSVDINQSGFDKKVKVHAKSKRLSPEINFFAIKCAEHVGNPVGASIEEIFGILKLNRQFEKFKLQVLSGQNNRNNPQYVIYFNELRRLVYRHELKIEFKIV